MEKIRNPRWQIQYARRLRTCRNFSIRHMRSSSRDLKGNVFGRIFYPLSFVVIALAFLELKFCLEQGT